MTQMLQLRTCRLTLAATAISTFMSWGSGQAATFSVQFVTDPTGTNFIQLLGINNSGTIAGTDNGTGLQGFTMTLPNNFTPQNFPGAPTTAVTAINNNGNTAGYFGDASGNTNGFTKIGTTFTVVNAPGTVFNRALGINDSNRTVGFSAATSAGTTGQVAYSQSGGVFTNVNALLPANVNSQATGINNGNNIVGFYQLTSTPAVGFLDVAGVITTIDPFSSTVTEALGINNAGEIVGFYVDVWAFSMVTLTTAVFLQASIQLGPSAPPSTASMTSVRSWASSLMPMATQSDLSERPRRFRPPFLSSPPASAA